MPKILTEGERQARLKLQQENVSKGLTPSGRVKREPGARKDEDAQIQALLAQATRLKARKALKGDPGYKAAIRVESGLSALLAKSGSEMHADSRAMIQNVCTTLQAGLQAAQAKKAK
jgi:hypothetical protein